MEPFNLRIAIRYHMAGLSPDANTMSPITSNSWAREKLRTELLNVGIFTTFLEAQVLIENWRKDNNQIRPHTALGYPPPTPEAIMSGYGSTTLSVVQ